MLVKILQGALKQANYYTLRTDGAYGPGTETAVKAYQQARGGTTDGACHEADWLDMTGIPAPSLFDRCVHLTAAFEGTGFEGAVGNFDGAYLTFGLIGMTLKSDLPDFIRLVEREHPGTLERAFGDKEPALRRIIAASDAEKQEWANSISTGPKRYGLRTDWKEAFARLGSIPEVQELQLKIARERYWSICVEDAKRWRCSDALDVAMLYDTAVQMGGAGRRQSVASRMDDLLRGEPALQGEQRRLRWARIIADGAKSPWQEDVFRRRAAIANGAGKVHGDSYVMADWGLAATPIDINALGSAGATYMPSAFTTAVGPEPVAIARPEPLTDDAPEPVADPIPAPIPTAPQPLPATPLPTPVAAAQIDYARDYKIIIAIALPQITRPNIDRNWGVGPAIPVPDLLERRAQQLPPGWREWEPARMPVAVVQLVCLEMGASPGEIDGYWGHVTDDAFEALVHLRDHGKLPANWRDDEDNNASQPSTANPRGWPKESHASLTAFYGSPCKARLVPVRCPWKLVASWDARLDLTTIRCHPKVAASLQAVLEAAHARYGEAELKRLHLDQFGGCYNCRPIRGGSSWSTHAWGIALDWDPDRNRLKWKKDQATLARSEFDDWWAIWEGEGWFSLGRRRNFDWMHVQAAWR